VGITKNVLKAESKNLLRHASHETEQFSVS